MDRIVFYSCHFDVEGLFLDELLSEWHAGLLSMARNDSMPLIACPACGKQISSQAPSCPHCGHPIAFRLIENSGETILQSTDRGKSKIGCFLIALIVAAVLAFLNPTEAEMRQKIGQDGWVPVAFERTNLILFNWVSVSGFTGATAKYLGIAGAIFKIG